MTKYRYGGVHGASVNHGMRNPDVLPGPAFLKSVALSGTVSTFKILRSRGAVVGKRTLDRAMEAWKARRLPLEVRITEL